MTLVSFGGPFVIVGVIWGGDSAGWPPDRPIEWVTIGLVLALFLVLFVACVSIRPLVPAETKMIRSWSCPERDDDVER